MLDELDAGGFCDAIEVEAVGWKQFAIVILPSSDLGVLSDGLFNNLRHSHTRLVSSSSMQSFLEGIGAICTGPSLEYPPFSCVPCWCHRSCDCLVHSKSLVRRLILLL